jgi:hypothetical protein
MWPSELVRCVDCQVVRHIGEGLALPLAWVLHLIGFLPLIGYQWQT